MKFNAVVGNPPYQENNGGGKGASGGASIYHHFVNIANDLKPEYISMIIQSLWYSGGGKPMQEFRKMMNNGHLMILHDYCKAKECFDNVEIKGGTCYFLIGKKQKGLCEFVIHEKNTIADKSERLLLEENSDVVIRYSKSTSIVKKVLEKTVKTFNKIVSANDPFGFDQRIEGTMKRLKPEAQIVKGSNSVDFYYNGWRKDGIKYIDRQKIKRNLEWVDSIKVLIPKAWGVGSVKTDRLNPFIVNPGSCCTETYLVVGPFESETVARNVTKYINTKFFHLMVSARKNTQNTMQDDYSFVPLQDFTPQSDIDWSKPIPEIDRQLYAKYSLTPEERSFIERMIKPME